MAASTNSGPGRQALVLATISFTLSFAAWGLVGGLASVFAELYQLRASETALLVAVPVLLGSLARLPMGMLTDRFGGRAMFTVLMVLAAIAAWLVPETRSYPTLLANDGMPRNPRTCDRRRSDAGDIPHRCRKSPRKDYFSRSTEQGARIPTL
jgi:nitrate/nitrite transporter NarK